MINHPFSIFGLIDSLMAHAVPLVIRLILWGAASGIIAIVIYAKIAPQKRIAKLKKNSRCLRKELKNLDLEFKDFYSLSIRNLKNSLEQLFLVIGPAIASAIPVLIVAIWLHLYFGYASPQELSKELFLTNDFPANLELNYEGEATTGTEEKNEIKAISKLRKLVLTADGSIIYAGNPFSPPTDVLYKRKWWNSIIENPNGYLDQNSPVDNIGLNIPKNTVLKGVPDWASGWEIPYFLSSFVFAIAIKLKFRIQ
jgi:hypothetical protein